MVKLLLAKGANRNLKDEDEQTPLMLAESADRQDIADLLRIS
jgi:ankyrin repeat protein